MGRTKAGRASAGSEAPRRTNTTLEVGQAIRVINGPLADFDGQISELMPDSGKVKVMLTIFGRDTPVELSLDQIATIV
jgi:transcriptional antiterminator NusG